MIERFELPWMGTPSQDTRALGWLEPTRFAEVAREVVLRDILDPLATIGVEITKEEREQLFDGLV